MTNQLRLDEPLKVGDRVRATTYWITQLERYDYLTLTKGSTGVVEKITTFVGEAYEAQPWGHEFVDVRIETSEPVGKDSLENFKDTFFACTVGSVVYAPSKSFEKL